jgi:hypothetical protein
MKLPVAVGWDALPGGARHHGAPMSGGHPRRAGVRRRIGRVLPAGRVASHAMGGCCEGLNGTLLEGFISDTRQQAMVAYERDAHESSVVRQRYPCREPWDRFGSSPQGCTRQSSRAAVMLHRTPVYATRYRKAAACHGVAK